MFIQTETTPNPNTLKFIPGKAVLEEGTKQFNKAEEAEISPLATALFATDGIKSVFLGYDFISVTKQEDIDWDIIKTAVLTTIMEHFVSNKPVLLDGTQKTTPKSDEVETQVIKEIKAIIEEKVRPAVAQDGGDIIYHKFEEGIVYLELHGACSGCPSATVTLKNGIENMLKHYIPEVEAVEAI